MLSGQRLAEVGQILTGLTEPQKAALREFVAEVTEDAVQHALDLKAPLENRERLAGGAGVLRDLQRDLMDLTNGNYLSWAEVMEWRQRPLREREPEQAAREDEEDPAMLTR